jgi:hypothetical protein
VLVIAGTPSMRGASTLAALGAQAVGAGRLYVGIDRVGDPRGRAGRCTRRGSRWHRRRAVAGVADPLRPELMARGIDIADADAGAAWGRRRRWSPAAASGATRGRAERSPPPSRIRRRWCSMRTA